MKLEKDVTLIAVDCVNVERVVKSFDISLSYVKFKNVKFLTSLDNNLSYSVKIKPIKTIVDYSKFMIKDLYKYVNTKFCLVTQHDSWICNPDVWDDDWFNYDYIGCVSNWSHLGSGNGGFSFRSKRLLKIGSKIIKDNYHPEDVVLASDIKMLNGKKYNVQSKTLERMGLKFATSDKNSAQLKFGIDCGLWSYQFGHHKGNLSNWNLNKMINKKKLNQI